MLSYDKMVRAVENLCINITETKVVTFGDVARETLVSRVFFRIFPEKLTALQEILLAEMNRES
jgi:hypothetical protein